MFDDEDYGQDEEEGMYGIMGDPDDGPGPKPQQPVTNEGPSGLQRLAFMLLVVTGTAGIGLLIGLAGGHGSLHGMWVGAAFGAFCGVGLTIYGILTIGKA
jgi:hypothetical protein